MNQENKEMENETPSSSALEERAAFKKVIAGLRDNIKLKNRDVDALQDELAEREALLDQREREFESERARRIKAESLVAETKKLDQNSREIYKKSEEEKFSDLYLAAKQARQQIRDKN
jgi:Skp family chaperone for outer membrane proteins